MAVILTVCVRFPHEASYILPWACEAIDRRILISFNDLPILTCDSCKEQDGQRPRLSWRLGHNKWICGSECCMYDIVWERLHVQGRRILGCARRTRNFTDSYPSSLKKQKNIYYRVNLRTFWRSGEKHRFGWWKIQKKKKKRRWKFSGFSSRTGRSRMCSCVHHGPV